MPSPIILQGIRRLPDTQNLFEFLCAQGDKDAAELVFSTRRVELYGKNSILDDVCSRGHVDMAYWLNEMFCLHTPFHPHIFYPDVLQKACEEGRFEIVKFVYAVTDVFASSVYSANTRRLARQAALHGHAEIAQWLCALPNGTSFAELIDMERNICLLEACKKGGVKDVEAIIAHSEEGFFLEIKPKLFATAICNGNEPVATWLFGQLEVTKSLADNLFNLQGDFFFKFFCKEGTPLLLWALDVFRVKDFRIVSVAERMLNYALGKGEIRWADRIWKLSIEIRSDLLKHINFVELCGTGHAESIGWVLDRRLQTGTTVLAGFKRALECRQMDVAKLLLQFGYGVQLEQNAAAYWFEILSHENVAVAQRYYDMCEIRGPFLKKKESFFENPAFAVSVNRLFDKVCSSGSMELVHWFHAKCPLLNIEYNDYSCFHSACTMGHLPVVQWLLQQIPLRKRERLDVNLVLREILYPFWFDGRRRCQLHILEFVRRELPNATFAEELLKGVFRKALDMKETDILKYFVYAFPDMFSCDSVKTQFVLKVTLPYRQRQVETDCAQEDTTQCPVCLEHEADVVTNCGHLFCVRCMSNWYSRKDTCPCCRAKLECTVARAAAGK